MLSAQFADVPYLSVYAFFPSERCCTVHYLLQQNLHQWSLVAPTSLPSFEKEPSTWLSHGSALRVLHDRANH